VLILRSKTNNKERQVNMSTRATIHFCDPDSKKPVAIIYRHGDGYPEGLGEDLKKFVEDVKKQTTDTRFNDPAYLAAKWVVWDAHQMATIGYGNDGWKKGEPSLLNFLSVGIVDRDPDDIEYRYTVICDGTPTIKHKKV
jgi:hypothetical protein